MAMYYYASKISAIACGTRCRKSVLQKSRGHRDRDKYGGRNADATQSQNNTGATTDTDDDTDDADGICLRTQCGLNEINDGRIYVTDTNGVGTAETSVSTLFSANGHHPHSTAAPGSDGLRYRRRFSEQWDNYDIGFQKSEVSNGTTIITATKNSISDYLTNNDDIQYDVPKNTYKRSQTDINFESSVVGSGGIMYINGKIVSGPLESLVDVLVPENINDLDKEFIFSFLLSSRLYLRPHELLGKLLSTVPDSGDSLESLVALLAEWTNKFPYDYRDERMMNHVKHIVARCSSTCLEATVSDILSALLNRLTDLERHEKELRSCQTASHSSNSSNSSKMSDMPEFNTFECRTSTQYAQILCRVEKKLAKHVGPEEFVQCNNNILLDKQKKWDQPSSAGGPPGVQDPKKTCNLETYLDWSARLRLFICNDILQCSGIRDRSKTVELWTGVAQYCLLVGNYNSATTILETLESPAIARLKITWSKLQVTCQQLDCMQRHAEGHGNLWHKQTNVLYENHHYQQRQEHRHETLSNKVKTEVQILTASTIAALSTSSTTTATTVTAALTDTSLIMADMEAETLMSGLCMSSRMNSTNSRNDSTSIVMAEPTPTTKNPIFVVVNEMLEKQKIKEAITTTTTTTITPTIESLLKTKDGKKTKNTTTTTSARTPCIKSDTKCATTAMPSNSITQQQQQQQQQQKQLSSSSLQIAKITNSSAIAAAAATTTTTPTSSTLLLSTNSTAPKTSIDIVASNATVPNVSNNNTTTTTTVIKTTTTTAAAAAAKPNDWVVIPVFADIVKLALTGRENCLQRLPNGHINIIAFDRMAAIVGAFTKHMQAVKSTNVPINGAEYEMFSRHMQKVTKLEENDLMLASFDCEEPNNAEKLMYDLN